MRSRAGVGITPPKVAGEPNPQSSVMMSSTLGAPLGGTTIGAHQGVDSEAFIFITPPNFGAGSGSRFPLMVIVALGEPGVPLICCACVAIDESINITTISRVNNLFINKYSCFCYVKIRTHQT